MRRSILRCSGCAHRCPLRGDRKAVRRVRNKAPSNDFHWHRDDDPARLRAPQSPLANSLHRVGERLLHELPPAQRPVNLAQQFPRIVNQLARLWDRPGDCLAYLDSLRFDRRGGRKGFAPEIKAEIDALHDWYLRRHAPHPKRRPHDPWADEPLRMRAADPVDADVEQLKRWQGHGR